VKISKFIDLLQSTGEYETKKISTALNGIVKRDKELHFTTDSRDIRENSVFIAIKGENTNGHNFVNDCFAKGAVISIVEEYGDFNGFCIKTENCIAFINAMASAYYSEIKPYTIALTGSNGKTSTKEWINSLLQCSFKKEELFCNPGNKNSEIGLPVGLLNGMNEKKKIAVLEMGMAKEGDINYLRNTYPPDFSIILNIGTAHIGNTGSLENTFLEKSQIIVKGKPLLLNISDRLLSQHFNSLKQEKDIYLFGLYEDAPVSRTGIFLKDFRYTLSNDNHYTTIVSIVIQNPEKGITFEKNLRIKGIYHRGFLLNLCAAFTTVYAIQNNLAFLEKIPDVISPVKGRFTFKEINHNLIIDDFYNSSIESLEFALETIHKLIENTHYGEVICILGSIAETGIYSKQIHEKIGSLLEQYKINEVIMYTKNKDIELLSKHFNRQKFYSDNRRIIASEIIRHIKQTEKGIYLFKASRSIQLEEVYENVLESFS